MEISSDGVIDIAFLLLWLVTRVVPKYGLLIPLALHRVGSSIALRSGLTQLRIQKRVTLHDLFLRCGIRASRLIVLLAATTEARKDSGRHFGGRLILVGVAEGRK